MAVTRCDKGHFYDGAKYPECPHCKDGMDDEKTLSGPAINKPRATGRMVFEFAKPSDGEEKTIGVFKKTHGHDPVTGWLVCVKGPERGRDYRLHSGRNFLGRAPQMDISVADDIGITRENHCSVVYDPKGRTFLLAPGSAAAYLNGQLAESPLKIATSDVISAGSSDFVFIPFCGEDRTWDT
jgi:hypothetical protein